MKREKMKTKSDRYYERLEGSKVILIDFDNTICIDEWPKVGTIIPGAIEVLTALQNAGHKIILYTQRSVRYPICHQLLEQYAQERGLKDELTIDILSDAVNLIRSHGIEFWDINENELWETMTYDMSRKVFNDYIIDDHCIGIKTNKVVNSMSEECDVVDWNFIDECCVNNGLYEHKVLF